MESDDSEKKHSGLLKMTLTWNSCRRVSRKKLSQLWKKYASRSKFNLLNYRNVFLRHWSMRWFLLLREYVESADYNDSCWMFTDLSDLLTNRSQLLKLLLHRDQYCSCKNRKKQTYDSHVVVMNCQQSLNMSSDINLYILNNLNFHQVKLFQVASVATTTILRRC